MLFKLTNLFWLICLFCLPCQLLQAQIEVKLNNNQEFRYDLKKGSFSLLQNKKPVFENAISSYQLKNGSVQDVSSSNPRALKQKFKDNAGSGICYSIEHLNKNGTKAIQNFYFYEGSSFFVMELVLKGKNISSNSLSPFHLKGQNLLPGKKLSSVFVPFDNDTFIEYKQQDLDSEPYESSELGILYDQNDQTGFLAASLDQSTWKTGILAKQENQQTDLEVKNGFVKASITRDSMEHGYISGNQINSSKILISYSKNWQDGLDEFAKFQRKLFPSNLKAWTDGTPVGWNSWGVIQTKLSWENATATVDYFKDRLPRFRNENGKAYIDLDSFWDNMVPGGMAGDYSKLKEFAEYCKTAGLEPGVYWAPFTDWGHGSGPDRKAEGSDYTFGEMWTKTSAGYHDLDGGRALDPTHPGTQARMKFILGKLKECGFKMIKIDFLSHAAIESSKFHNPNIKTGMQAYAVGMRYLNELLDNQMLIYAAISPSLATYKYAHMRRIACDAWKTIDQTAYTLNSLTFGFWQTYLYDYIDADHLVFTGESHDVNVARFLSGVVAGPLILGDDFSQNEEWHSVMEPILQNQEILNIIKNGKSFRPLPIMQDNRTSNVFLKREGNKAYLIAFNFKEGNAHFDIDLKNLGLTGNYNILDLINNQESKVGSKMKLEFESIGAKIFKLEKE